MKMPPLPAGNRRCLGIALGLLALASPGCSSKLELPPQEPPPVVVARPVRRSVVDYVECSGRTEAVRSVDVRARVSGYLRDVLFGEGTEVKRGQTLFQIDPRPLQAELDRLLAQVAVQEAEQKFRLQELERGKHLLPKSAVSQSDYDSIVARQQQAVAEVAAAKANAEVAKLNLAYAKIEAPLDGRISRAQITAGNLVNADSTLLTSIVSVDPMYVYFDVDEGTILRFQKAVREGKIQADEDEHVPVFMALGLDEGFPYQGEIDFAENRFETSTATIRVRAVFANPKPAKGPRPLMPGHYARVRIPLNKPYEALLVPERALATDQGQKYVFVINAENKAEYRKVELGRREGSLRVIHKGVTADDRVVVQGVQRVRDGEAVSLKQESPGEERPAVPSVAEQPRSEGSDKPPKPASNDSAKGRS